MEMAGYALSGDQGCDSHKGARLKTQRIERIDPGRRFGLGDGSDLQGGGRNQVLWPTMADGANPFFPGAEVGT